MKKIVALVVLLYSAATFSQSIGWTNLKETNITVGANAYDIFTNGAGNHIIVQEANALKYYKMDVNGNIIINLDPPLESSAVTSPSISGDLTRIYVVYRKGNESKIRTKYSTDGGVNWSYISDLNLSGTPSSIECVFVKNQLNITYLVGTDVYHSFYNLENPPWSIPHEVYPNNTTSDPRIAVWNEEGNEQVFITYMSGTHFRWTKYNVNAPSYFDWFFNQKNSSKLASGSNKE